MRRLSGMVAIVVLASLSGCGPKVTKVPLTPNQKLRTMYVGDSAIYRAQVRLYAIGVLQQESERQNKITVEAPTERSPLASQMAYVFNMTRREPMKDGEKSYTLVETEMLGFGKDGGIYQLGHTDDTEGLAFHMPTGGFYKDATPFVYMPPVLTSSSSWDYMARCQDGDILRYAAKVEGVEWIDTPIGKYETYKINVTLSSNKHGSYTGYIWIAPQLGCIPLKRDMEVNMLITTDFKYHIVETLDSIKLAGMPTTPVGQAK